jgi:quercetin dioxygenase-like cupin family protein
MPEYTMRRILLVAIAMLAIAPIGASAQGTPNLTITRAATREASVAPAANFTGTVRVQPLFDTTPEARAYGASVAFDSGARTAWHSHPRGQVLIVTEGVGRVQLWRASAEEIRPGDVVRIPPGAKHWHGAAPTTAMTHTAIVESLDGRSTEWMEKVSDEQYAAPVRAQAAPSAPAEEVLSLSRDKWRWMSERKVDSLAALFHDQAVFVHMGATMSRSQELDVIRGGGIQYKTIDIQESSVRFVGTTAILLNRIRLVAVVGGNEVTNPFMVTEVYVQQNGRWMLTSLSFTRLTGA